jgi:hypothetical protein
LPTKVRTVGAAAAIANHATATKISLGLYAGYNLAATLIAVPDRLRAAQRVFDETGGLHHACGQGYCWSLYSQHLRHGVMRKRQRGLARTIHRCQEPPRQPLFHIVSCVAGT